MTGQKTDRERCTSEAKKRGYDESLRAVRAVVAVK